MKKRALKNNPSAMNGKEWRAKIDKKLRQAQDIILENDLEMQAASLKQRIGVNGGTKSDPAK